MKKLDGLFLIKDVPYFTQIDNKLFARSACYPTSNAMAIQYCLDEAGASRGDIGCIEKDEQLEDYITKLTESESTRNWIKRNVSKYGAWMLRYKPRTIAKVEEHIFNILMDRMGYAAQFRVMTWENFCRELERQELPMPVRGYFPALLGGGHICCAVGHNKHKREIIVHDPFGNANDKYARHDNGAGVNYPADKWFINKKGKIWVLAIRRKK